MPNSSFLEQSYPVDVVFAPEWWHKTVGMTFDADFFYHPVRRVEEEQRMEKTLREKWGEFGLGENADEPRPEVGPVHLAAGYLISEMLGCKVEYLESHPPRVLEAGQEVFQVTPEAAFQSGPFKRFADLMESLKQRYGYLCGDVNWGGVLNAALDLRGEGLFTDMMLEPDAVRMGLHQIAEVVEKFVGIVESETRSSSISVNRTVGQLGPVYLHSECSHTMISTDLYEEYLMPIDAAWANKHPLFGIHYCGSDPHRFAESFGRLPRLDFLDVGWGGDVKELRKHLPHTFLNIRLDPRGIGAQTPDTIRGVIRSLAVDSGDPLLTGFCCINMDDQMPDANVTAILETVRTLREEAAGRKA